MALSIKTVVPSYSQIVAKTEKCDGCNAFPTLCWKTRYLHKECNVSAFQAQNCFQSGKIDEAKCKQVYPQCQAADPKCAACRGYLGCAARLSSASELQRRPVSGPELRPGRQAGYGQVQAALSPVSAKEVSSRGL